MIKTVNKNIYIVMYHYVRNIKKSKYPNLKGLEFSDFRKQIIYFKKILTYYQIINLLRYLILEKFQKKSILLTFDDGYRDHFEYVFPF